MSRHVPAGLTAATWNIHGGRDRNGQLFHFEERAAQVGADIFGLQELELHRTAGGAFESPSLLADNGLKYSIAEAFSDSPFSGNAGLAVALLSAAAFTRTRTVTLPNLIRTMEIDPNFHDKGLIVSEIFWQNRTIDVIALHLFPFHRAGLDARDSRLRPLWAELDKLLRPRPGTPRIIMGDFNTPHRFELLRCLQVGELKSIFLNSPSRDDGQSHDDILVSPQWHPQRLRNIHNESDHNLLIADLILNLPGDDDDI